MSAVVFMHLLMVLFNEALNDNNNKNITNTITMLLLLLNMETNILFNNDYNLNNNNIKGQYDFEFLSQSLNKTIIN